MINNLVDMFVLNTIFIRIMTPFNKSYRCEKLDDVVFKPLYARYKHKKVHVKGRRTKIVREKKRFCFDSYADVNEIYLDSDLLTNVGMGKKGGDVKMHVTKKMSTRLLSDGNDSDDGDDSECKKSYEVED